MNRKEMYFISCLIFLATVFLLLGCSSGNNPVATQAQIPDNQIVTGSNTSQDTQPERDPTSERFLLDYGLIYLNTENQDRPGVEIIPLRAGFLHLNILKILEVMPCTNCFKIVGFDFPEPGVLDVDIEITHPFSDLDLSIFDVRVIMMFQGSKTFPASGLTMSDPDLGDGFLRNAEGLSTLFNGNTPDAPTGDFFKYFPGRFSTLTLPNSSLNGYVYYTTDDPANTRNAFYAGDSVTRTLSIKLPTSEFILGYAVDANWALPLDSPVDDPIEDFGLDANSPEPYKIEITEDPIGDGLTNAGGETELLIDVYDWQGKESHFEPVIECFEIFEDTITASWLDDGPGYARYLVTISNEKLADVGEYTCLVSVEDNENATSPDWMDLTAYQTCTINISEFVHQDPVAAATADTNPQTVCENIHFDGTTSHDPDGGTITKYEWSWDNGQTYDPADVGSEIDHAWDTPGTYNVQLRVTDDEGAQDILDAPLEIQIVNELPTAVVEVTPADYFGYPYFFDGSGSHDNDCGDMEIVSWDWDFNNDGYVDASGVETEFTFTEGGDHEVQLKVTDDEGESAWLDEPVSIYVEPRWTDTIGGADDDSPNGIDTDPEGNVYICGEISGTVDFDPSDSVFNLEANDDDAFVAKYGPEGELLWAYSWGSDGGWSEKGVDIEVDYDNNKVLVLGKFTDQVDFDPVGEDIHDWWDEGEVYIAEYDLAGNYQQVIIFGGVHNNGRLWPYAMDISETGNSMVICGLFSGTCDFDPGETEEKRSTPTSANHAWLLKLDSNYNFDWVSTWGTDVVSSYVRPKDVSIGIGNVIYCIGYSNYEIDLDPDPFDELLSIKRFLVMYGSTGQFVDGFGNYDPWIRSVWADPDSYNFYIGGSYRINEDLDPGDGTWELETMGHSDAFLCKFSSTPVSLEWVRHWGSYQHDSVWPISGNSVTQMVAVGGYFGDTIDFGEGLVDNNGEKDVFVNVFTFNGYHVHAYAFGGTGDDECSKLVWNEDLDWLLGTGKYTGTVDFDPGPLEDIQDGFGGIDIWITKF